MTQNTPYIIVPNWNGKDSLAACFDSLLNQSLPPNIIVVENASSDGSLEFIQDNYPTVIIVKNDKNLGFAGGVNSGIKKAIELGGEYVALFNNDAIADKYWLEHLVNRMDDQEVGIVTGKLLKSDKITFDSTGDYYTAWGLAYPRGRGEKDTGQYDKQEYVLAATGGASLYRVSMLDEIGIFDKDFFAYYEDVDISLRAQLAGWKILYEPHAKAYHAIGGTSGKIKGFTTYQTIKNLPWLFWKNVPMKLFLKMWPRFFIAHNAIIISSILQGKLWPVSKGITVSFALFPKKLIERRKVQANRKVTIKYIDSLIIKDLPPNADKLKKLRQFLKIKY